MRQNCLLVPVAIELGLSPGANETKKVFAWIMATILISSMFFFLGKVTLRGRLI